jgi:hypothetical protein
VATIGPQPTGHRPQRRGLITEPLSDLVEWRVIDEERAESLVAALNGLLGREEELPGVAPVHDAGSRLLIIFWPETKADRTAKTGAEKASKRLRASCRP